MLPLSKKIATATVTDINKLIKEGFLLRGTPSAIRELGRRTGTSPSTVKSRLASAFRLYGLKPGSTKRPEDLPDALISLLKNKPRSLAELAAKTMAPMGAILDATDSLRNRGVNVLRTGDVFEIPSVAEAAFIGGTSHVLISNKDNTFTFGAAGDLHAASKYCRWDVREDLYKRFIEEGASCNFDTGNWIDGMASFNRYDIEAHGLDEQCKLLARNHPKGLPTFAVWGDDHEGWLAQREGIDAGKYNETIMREAGHEWTNLGFMESHITLKNANSGAEATMAVVHPGGGSSYALSYSIQKIIESYEGGEKPHVGLYGHYHKLWAGIIRNVWAVQTGCFSASTRITTDRGRITINKIKVGDRVLTHRNTYRKVTKVHKHLYEGEWVGINYGRIGRQDQTVTMTSEHPVLVEKNNIRCWLPAADVEVGDTVFIVGKTCPITNETIPYWMRMSRNANPIDLPGAKAQISKHYGGFKRKRGGSGNETHLQNDILPFCNVMIEQGWTMIPTGGGITPDAIGIKNDKVVAFELEKTTGNYLNFKQQKYKDHPLSNYIDEVQWIHLNGRKGNTNCSWYETDDNTGLVKVKVVQVTRKPYSNSFRPKVSVYNLSVEEDNSFMAGNMAVHNCGQDQTPFMRKKRLEAHVGGVLVKLEQDPSDGSILSMTPKMFRYFNKGFYEGRWSKHGPVSKPARSRTNIR